MKKTKPRCGRKGALIGLSGKTGSGKDTLADFVCSMDPRFRKVAFADAYRKSISVLTGVPLSILQTHEGENTFCPKLCLTPGQIMQHSITDARRHRNKGVDYLERMLHDIGSEEYVIITDVHFKDEAKAIKQVGGFMVRVEGDPTNISGISTKDLSHQSEISLDNYTGFDVIIDNNAPGLDIFYRTIQDSLSPFL